MRTFYWKWTLIDVRQSYMYIKEIFMNIDLLLYERTLAGDEKALDELINKYRNPLTLFINGFVKDMDVAESLMIDVFAELICKKSKFRGESSIKTYLFAIGRNKALKHIKKSKSYEFIPLDEVGYCIMSEQTVDDALDQKICSENLHNALNELNPKYREILYLLFFEDMSYEQAAQVLHKNKKQISNLAFRAKQALKKILTQRECLYENN